MAGVAELSPQALADSGTAVDKEQRSWPLRRAQRNPTLFIGLVLLAAVTLVAIVGPLFVATDPLATSADVVQPPSPNHPFGTDEFGRDILARLIFALRLDLFVALVSVTCALALGVLIGATSGYIGGRFDDIVMRFIDVIQSFPMLILAIGLVAFLGVGIRNIIVVTIIINIPIFARLVRGDILLKKQLEYVDAARFSGCSGSRILVRHLLPNTIGPLLVQGSLNLAWALLNVAALSFLGVGINPPTPDLGLMIADGARFLSQGAWWLSVYPGAALAITIFAFNLIGDGLQDCLDPRRAGR
jgi:peptide/nickel transport system permease protein